MPLDDTVRKATRKEIAEKEKEKAARRAASDGASGRSTDKTKNDIDEILSTKPRKKTAAGRADKPGRYKEPAAAKPKRERVSFYDEGRRLHRVMPVVLILLGVAFGVCMIGDALKGQTGGYLGHLLTSGVGTLFGGAAYALPLLFVLHGLFWKSDVRRRMALPRILFSLAAWVAMAAILEVITSPVPIPEMTLVPDALMESGRSLVGGGLFGGAVAYGLYRLLGRVCLWIVLAAVLVLYVASYPDFRLLHERWLSHADEREAARQRRALRREDLAAEREAKRREKEEADREESEMAQKEKEEAEAQRKKMMAERAAQKEENEARRKQRALERAAEKEEKERLREKRADEKLSLATRLHLIRQARAEQKRLARQKDEDLSVIMSHLGNEMDDADDAEEGTVEHITTASDGVSAASSSEDISIVGAPAIPRAPVTETSRRTAFDDAAGDADTSPAPTTPSSHAAPDPYRWDIPVSDGARTAAAPTASAATTAERVAANDPLSVSVPSHPSEKGRRVLFDDETAVPASGRTPAASCGGGYTTAPAAGGYAFASRVDIPVTGTGFSAGMTAEEIAAASFGMSAVKSIHDAPHTVAPSAAPRGDAGAAGTSPATVYTDAAAAPSAPKAATAENAASHFISIPVETMPGAGVKETSDPAYITEVEVRQATKEVREGTYQDEDDAPERVPKVVPIRTYEIPKPARTPDAPSSAGRRNAYRYPGIDLLREGTGSVVDEEVQEEIARNSERLIDTLDSFHVATHIVGTSRGPRITRYEIMPDKGVRINSITSRIDDISLNLATAGIRIEAPIPGMAAVGVEVPNRKPTLVRIRDLLSTDEFLNATSKSTVALGADVTGRPVYADIAKMPHLLIAGATGMGKSVCINAILLSLLYKARPDEVKLILVDPKKVELGIYNNVPHLLVPVVTDPQAAAGSLIWAVGEMERRFELIEQAGVRDLKSYNTWVGQHPDKGQPLPKIIIIIDELNDLMMSARDAVEASICRIAQKARAAGMHLIIGTQRPSVDVITGLIKANIPSRIAFHVTSQVDSRTILDFTGAEKLLDKGDMLAMLVGLPEAKRIQGSMVEDEEVEKVTTFLKENAAAGGFAYDSDIMDQIQQETEKYKASNNKGGDDLEEDLDQDELDEFWNQSKFRKTVELAVRSGKISTSLIQRKMSLGYGKAAKYIDVMEQMGIVGPPDGQKPREVKIDEATYQEMVARHSN